MGASKVNIFCEDMFFKDAHTPEVTPWHHDMPSQRAELPIRSWDMAPGDVQVFHGYMVHGSSGNTTDHARRAFITRWCGDDVVYAWKGEATYPQFPGCSLEPGGPLDSETFPVIWRASPDYS